MVGSMLTFGWSVVPDMLAQRRANVGPMLGSCWPIDVDPTTSQRWTHYGPMLGQYIVPINGWLDVDIWLARCQ